MTQPTTNTARCGKLRASLLYGAPILSEVGACVLPHGHDGDHRDPRGGTWNVIPLYPMTNPGRGTDE
ncbi:hypothetical protein [Streptomyces sp. GQFP]|uniref:hypothetical protein n=1 Tax=Streptomyces sp. GQFP TaxID=2907545 RepID=UPI001F3D31EF|nr:hypothetical protein [Streptomyces sp. GQFP]UIX35150.1 hypothetical protein LUX31_36980 [Streptomyces sp. GQFP]